MALVSEVKLGSATCTGLAAPLVLSGVGTCAFRGWLVCVALAEFVAYLSGLGPPCLGETSKAAYFFGVFQR